MKWQKRVKEIERLRRNLKNHKYRVPPPDLRVEQRTAPCSNVFAVVSGKHQLPSGAKQFPIGHSHKQGLELITPHMIQHDLQHLGGKKT